MEEEKDYEREPMITDNNDNNYPQYNNLPYKYLNRNPHAYELEE